MFTNASVVLHTDQKKLVIASDNNVKELDLDLLWWVDIKSGWGSQLLFFVVVNIKNRKKPTKNLLFWL